MLELCAVADAKHWQASYKLCEIDLECFWVVNRIGRAAEDYSDYRRVVFRELVVGKNLAEGVELTHATANELGRLRAEVENDNLLLHVSFF